MRDILAKSSDWLLWGALLCLLALGWFLYESVTEHQTGQVIRLRFTDANEISRGAAVRMMGTEIGFVKDVRLRDNYVDIIVKTYPGTLKIPSGSTFTILFTGLVGSKSIEVVPPTTTRPLVRGKPQYIVEEPIRLRQALQYQIDIAKALQEGAENFADFFGQHQPVEDLQYNILKSRDATGYAKEYLATLNQTLIEKNQEAGTYLMNINISIQDFANATMASKKIFAPQYLGTTVNSTIRYILLFFNESHAAMVTFDTAKGVRQINGRIQQSVHRVQQIPRWDNPEILLHWDRFNHSIREFNQAVDTFAGFIPNNPLPHLRRVDNMIKSWNQWLEDANRKF